MSATVEVISTTPSGHGRQRGWKRLMRRVARSVLQLVIVVVLIVVGTAVLVRLVPGDPAQSILGMQATPESLAALRAQLGLDQQLSSQILSQLSGLMHGDFGTSMTTQRPVISMVGSALPITLSLVVTGILFALVISFPLGLLPAFGMGRRGVHALRISMVVLVAIPSFLVGIYLLILFSVQLHWAPAGGWSKDGLNALRYLWLPSLALALFMTPIFVRSIERETTRLMSEEFVEAAISRGISRVSLITRHVLPNVLLPVITLIGFSMAVLIGGAVIIEALYGIPGIGSVVVTAVGQRDYPVIVGVTVFTGIFTVVISLITDVVYTIADPRVRVQ
ncbi:ABC transporter permease [Pseudarthrobacter sp. MEB009]|uniref:ABC transporter permease n=1 Tax=Pseudarthrobacter sp. MEB009 TaxID=3040326 RepID=UPI002553B2FC|nr:ABC transporter permease [Pseudarthrobacter sp. MEB009]